MKNNMKKFLFLGAMAAMLLGTASCSKDMEPEMSDGTVQFKVELPGNIDSRAISDGLTATELDVACYDADGKFIEPTISITPFNERVATVTVKLVKGQKYKFAFFAHAQNAPYTFTPGANIDGCKFDVDYTGACNAENRDAFFAVLEDYEVTATETPVELHRPFAQLNFGADDLAAAKAAGIIPSQSKVKVSKAASTFSLFSGETSNDVENIEYTLANLPDATTVDGVMTPATLTVEGNDYAWMEMCYFLVPGNEANVNVEMTVKTNKADVEVPVNSVPVKKNHRTNIVGSLFTQDANFKVIIEPAFDTPDYNVEPINPILVKTEDELKAALNGSENKNIYIKLLNDVELSYGARTAYGNANTESITIDGDGHTLNLKGTDGDWSSFGILGNGDLTLKNMTINKTEPGNGAWNNHAINIANRKNGSGTNELGNGKLYLQNIIFNNSVAISNDATIEGCTFNEAGAFYTLIINGNVKQTDVINSSFKATNGGRGIKVVDQYFLIADSDGNPIKPYQENNPGTLQQVNINVSDCSFETAKKAAILVTNIKGAKITASNLDITKVAADPDNAVWNDEDRADYYDLVVVSGCTKKQE